MKISFKNDYAEGAHPAILEALMKTNLTQQAGYGLDDYSLEAKALIREKIKNPNARIHFVSSGTQANLLVIAALLRPYESVIAPDTAHIADNETGAIEAVGHKIHLAPSINGKITPEDIAHYATCYTNFPHQVKPRLVYITNSTEVGTIYTLAELKAIYTCCQAYQLLLFMDGARLGSALNAQDNDIQWEDLAQYTDVFYIGATKNGGLLGEAIVINKSELQEGFEYHLKQKGALLAKGRLLGIQFLTLFQNDLYNTLARYANERMQTIKEAFAAAGYPFLADTTTNQSFPILPNKSIDILAEKFEFYRWKTIDKEHTAIRLITSWATTPAQVAALIEAIGSLADASL